MLRRIVNCHSNSDDFNHEIGTNYGANGVVKVCLKDVFRSSVDAHNKRVDVPASLMKVEHCFTIGRSGLFKSIIGHIKDVLVTCEVDGKSMKFHGSLKFFHIVSVYIKTFVKLFSYF
jgi:hypothetical protein